MPGTNQSAFTEMEIQNIKEDALKALQSELFLTLTQAEALVAALTIEENNNIHDFLKKFCFHMYGLVMMPVITDRAKIKKYLHDNLNFRPDVTTPADVEQSKSIAQQFIVDSQIDLIIELQGANLPAESFLGKQLAKVAAAEANGTNSEVPATDLTIRQVGVIVSMLGEHIPEFNIADARAYLSRMKTANGILQVRADLRRLVLGNPYEYLISFTKFIQEKLEDFTLAIKVMPVFKTQKELRQYIIDNIELPLDLNTNQNYLATQIIPKYASEEYCRKLFMTSISIKAPTGESYIAQSCSRGEIVDSSDNCLNLLHVTQAVKALVNNLFFTTAEAREYVQRLSSAEEILELPQISLDLRLGIMSKQALAWMIDVEHFGDDLVRDSVYSVGDRWPVARTKENCEQLKALQQELLKPRFLTTLAKVPKTSYRETVGATYAYIIEDLEIQISKIDHDLVDIYNGKPLLDRRHFLVRAQEYVSQNAVAAAGNLAKSISFYTLKAGNYFFNTAKTPAPTSEVGSDVSNRSSL